MTMLECAKKVLHMALRCEAINYTAYSNLYRQLDIAENDEQINAILTTLEQLVEYKA